VLLTRSPLGHLPEGRASLDLHVLSTPPAFVLSQDQTLREGIFDISRLCRTGPDCRHRKSPSCDGFNHWFIRAGSSTLCVSRGCLFCSMYQRNLFHAPTEAGPWTRVNKMALTFGTLLSSQGADAHHHDSFEAFRGNPRYFTWSVPHGQTRPALPRLPLGRGDSRRVRCLVLGGTSARLHPALASRRGPLRDSVSRTRRTLVRALAGCKFGVQTYAAQCFRGVHRRGIGVDRKDRRV
jgi:hypothetical protein